jgi:hypothetical protein
MRSSNSIVNATHAARLISAVLLSTLVVGCGTTKVARDEFYPADWPDIVGAAEDCRGIEGAFENRGVLVDEKGQRREVFFTDLWRLAMFTTPMETETELKNRSELRACEHVRLSLQSFAYRGLYSELNALRLIIRPSPQSTRDSQALVEPCTELRVPIGNPYPFNQRGEPNILAYCIKSSLQVSLQWGTGGYAWLLGLAGDGSLLVRMESAGLVGTPPIGWPTMEGAWARFNKVP